MESWQQNEAFRSMDPQKQNMIEQLAASLHGKKLTEALPLLTRWKRTMQQENIQFTPEENQILTDIFSAQLTPQQKKQFEFISPRERRNSARRLTSRASLFFGFPKASGVRGKRA